MYLINDLIYLFITKLFNILGIYIYVYILIFVTYTWQRCEY